MKTTTFSSIPQDIDVLFDSIYTDAELKKFLRSRADRSLRNKMDMYGLRRKKGTVGTDAKRELLKALGFIEVHKSMWRLPTREEAKAQTNSDDGSIHKSA